MTEQEARSRAEAARAAHRVPAGATADWAERRWIGLAEPPGGPGPVRDALAWIVHFGAGASWVEVALEDRTGTVVRVQRSR